MYTKEETYYMIIFRKSLKSYRANNYYNLGIEFKTYEAAENYLTNNMEKIQNDPTLSKLKEAIIVKFTNNPVKTFEL